MTLNEALERLLLAFERYYNIRREDVTPPFQAEAEFLQHDERYFLTRSVKLSESDARETVYFATVEALDAATFARLDEAAWRDGLSRLTPRWGHRAADVRLVILTNRLEADAAEAIRRTSRSKGYAFSLKGWSNYRLIAMELPTGTVVTNRLGRPLKDALRKILQSKGIET